MSESVSMSESVEVKPRNNKHWTYSLSIGQKEAAPRESAYLKKHYTVFLGQGGNFDYWGDPSSGRVISAGVPNKGTYSTQFGDHQHWFSYRRRASDLKLTQAGESWWKKN